VTLLAGCEHGAGSPLDRHDVVTVGDATTSWEDLLAAADATATRLTGARAVAVCAAPTMSTITAIVAGLRAGVAVVPIAHDAGHEERRHILNDSGAVAVLGEHQWNDLEIPTLPLGGVGDSAPRGGVVTDLNGAALVMYTSGTTGAPKGVLLPESAIAACLDGLADAWQWTADDHLVHGLPLFHVHGLVLGVLGALRRGSRLTHTVRPTPEAYAAANGSLYFAVPTVWSRVVNDATSARALSSARAIVSGSAALPVPVFEGLRELTGLAALERYGMTETLITLSTRLDGERRPGHVGTPLAGVATRIRADDGTLAPHDGETIGTLEVRGATVGAGYLGRPDVTAASITDDGWFVTGDSAVIGPDGMHRIAGRTSVDIIKSGGYKVGAGEVETSILGFPGVAEVAVVGVADNDLGQRIEAAVVPQDGADINPDAVIDHVARQLSIHKRPRRVHIVESLPRNALGKVQKARLTEQLGATT
jgi:fatty acid CoA ligase FadD36